MTLLLIGTIAKILLGLSILTKSSTKPVKTTAAPLKHPAEWRPSLTVLYGKLSQTSTPAPHLASGAPHTAFPPPAWPK